jgi:hypothetical protein
MDTVKGFYPPKMSPPTGQGPMAALITALYAIRPCSRMAWSHISHSFLPVTSPLRQNSGFTRYEPAVLRPYYCRSLLS